MGKTLAVHGGTPLFATLQHVGGPIVEEETRVRFHQLADTAFQRNHFTNNGPLAQQLEEEVAARHSVRHAVFVANATVAEMLLLQALGLTSGDVIVPSNTFVATAHAALWQGLNPVFCDLDPDTLTLDPADAEKRLTPATRAIIPTHVFGVFADMPRLRDFARAHGLLLLADAAHAFDCTLGETFAGGFGVPEFLSFHATKYFSTLEGGAILTSDDGLADDLRARRNFGFDRPEDAGCPGINAKASEMSAAFGLASLPALAARRARLQAIHAIYREELSGVPGLRIHPVDAAGRNNYRYFSVFIEDSFPLSRDSAVEVLRRENILARRYFHPGCHRMAYYREKKPGLSLPRTERALDRILSLPTSFVGVDDAAAAARSTARLFHEMANHANNKVK